MEEDYRSASKRFWRTTVKLGDFNAHMGNDSNTWRCLIGRNDLPDLNPEVNDRLCGRVI